MRYLSEIFWTLSWNVCILNPNNSEFLIWLSFCQLAYFLNEIMSIQGYLQLWIKYISEFFGYIPRIFLDYFQIILYFLYICQSVCQSLYFFQLVISGGQLLRPLVLFDYSSCMYLWKKLLDCISLKWFSACLVFMPTIRTANQKPPVIDIQPLKYYNYFPTTFLMIYLKWSKKINRLLVEPELPS